MIVVLVAEPDDVLAAVVAECLPAERFTVIRSVARTSAELVHEAREHGAGVLVAGPSGPHTDLPPVIGKLVAAGTRTLVLSDHSVDGVGVELLLAGASGHLVLADSPMADLAAAVTAVASGRTALHPDVAAEVLRQWRDATSTAGPAAPAPATRSAPRLTDREHDVLDGLALGLTNRELAARLGVAEKTVEAHRTRLYTKLGAKNQNHAVSIARELGLTAAG